MSSRVSDSPPNSSESLHGLKFGQKIYFEDVGAGAPAKLGSGSQASAEGKKVKSGGPATLQPPRCQVEGCKVDLTDAKAYYSRHKVCGPHSKTPIVIVAGLEQRFCQQCSRFHQLSEFDQGKRSCRRRLAGHNERRRKTPAGSLLSPHFGEFSTSIFETSKDFGKSGSFMMDFSSHAKLPARNRHRSPTLPCEWASGSRSGSAENLLPPWHAHPGSNPPSNLYLQGSAGPGIPSCFVGVSDDSVCAHSLLSSVSWDGQPSSMAQQAALLSPFPSNMWAHRDNESASGSSQQMATNLGLGQISPPVHSQFPDQLDYGGGRPYMEVEHPRAYDISSTQQINWPL